MPIELNEFKKWDWVENKGFQTNKVMKLLMGEQKAYTIKEISEITGIKHYVVSTILQRQRHTGLLVHKSPYWAFNWEYVPFPEGTPIKVPLKRLLKKRKE